MYDIHKKSLFLQPDIFLYLIQKENSYIVLVSSRCIS